MALRHFANYLRNIADGLRTNRRTISQFPPPMAESVIPIVIDHSQGFLPEPTMSLSRVASSNTISSLPASSAPAAASADDLRLRDALKHCPPAVHEAVRRFRQEPRAELLPLILNNLIERYVAPDLRVRLQGPSDDLLLLEHLGLDSLSLMEIMIRLEDVFPITIRDDELRQVRTLGDIRQLIQRHTAGMDVADSI